MDASRIEQFLRHLCAIEWVGVEMCRPLGLGFLHATPFIPMYSQIQCKICYLLPIESLLVDPELISLFDRQRHGVQQNKKVGNVVTNKVSER